MQSKSTRHTVRAKEGFETSEPRQPSSCIDLSVGLGLHERAFISCIMVHNYLMRRLSRVARLYALKCIVHSAWKCTVRLGVIMNTPTVLTFRTDCTCCLRSVVLLLAACCFCFHAVLCFCPPVPCAYVVVYTRTWCIAMIPEGRTAVEGTRCSCTRGQRVYAMGIKYPGIRGYLDPPDARC